MTGISMPTAHEALRRSATFYMAALSSATNLYQAGGERRSLGIALFDSEWDNIQHARSLLINEMRSLVSSIKEGAGGLELMPIYAPVSFLLIKHIDFGTQLIDIRRPARDLVDWLEPLVAEPMFPGLPDVEINILVSLGKAYDRQSQNRRAVEYFERALKLAIEHKNRLLEGRILSDLGSATASLGEYAAAVSFQERSLKIMVELDNKEGESQALFCLGLEYISMDDLSKGIDYLQRALAADHLTEHHSNQGKILGELASAQLLAGAGRSDTLANLNKALALARESGNRLDETGTLIKLAVLSDDATHLETAIANCRELGWRRPLGILGGICRQRGDYRQAIECFSAALDVAHERDDVAEEIKALVGLADSHHELQEYKKTVVILSEALRLSRDQNSRVVECSVLQRLSSAHDKIGDQEGSTYLEDALVILRKLVETTEINKAIDDWMHSCEWALGREPHDVKAMAKKGFLLAFQKRTERGLAYLDRSIDLDRQDPNTHYLKGMALAEFRGEYSLAESSLNEARRLGLLDAEIRIARFWQTLENKPHREDKP